MHPLPPPTDTEPLILWRNVPRFAIAIAITIGAGALIRYLISIM